MFLFVLHPGNLLVGQADGGDLIGECDWPSHAQQSDVTVQIFPPVVLGMDNDFFNRHNLLDATLKSGKLCKYSGESTALLI